MPLALARTDRQRIGAVLLALGTVQFFVMHLVVQSAWTDPPYSWRTNHISNLGAVHCGLILDRWVCSPWHAGMNAAFIAQGLLLLSGTILTADAWSTAGKRRIWQVMIAITGIAWVFVGAFPEDVNSGAHSASALPIFLVGNTALIVAGVSTSTRDRPTARWSAVVLGSIALVSCFFMAYASTDPCGPIGVGISERFVVFPLQLWAFIAGVAILRRPGVTSRQRPTQES